MVALGAAALYLDIGNANMNWNGCLFNWKRLYRISLIVRKNRYKKVVLILLTLMSARNNNCPTSNRKLKLFNEIMLGKLRIVDI